MSLDISCRKSSAYIISQCQARYERLATAQPLVLHPAITISHETGAGVRAISEQLVQQLQDLECQGNSRWAVFDQELIETALQEHRWPKELAQKITEEKRLFIDELMDDLFGLRPPSWVLVPQVVETTLRLAMAGHVILVGHGATVVTANLPNVFHVRLTGSLPKRIERVQKRRNLTPEAAARFVRTEDRRRARYLKAHFHARLDEELHYDLVVNTDRFSTDDAAAVVAEGARRFFAAPNISTVDDSVKVHAIGR
ncbi:MAG TPA: cytidylate kinase-like family protein [Verrucomicrobiae bacterium]|nr:cytidylate kinase-like family protein [Verrucomicrobiae bacterium]